MFHEGQQIGLYTLIRKLGRGGFGEVWLAERKAKFVTTKVAVKLPHEEQVDTNAIRQEATLWEQASGHPNVLPIIDADIYDGQVVIVSEFAEEGSLADKLKSQGAFTTKAAVEMTIGILKGLEFLHKKQIIHRDIKPQNILLQDDTPRLADFGISRAIQTASISSMIVGTDAYMAPESFSGKRNVQTDIWSVGVVFYQLLKNLLPFPQPHPSEKMYAILQQEFEPLPANIPKNVKNIIAKALAKLPENRYKTANEMREDLRRVLLGKSIIAKKSPLKETVVIPQTIPEKVIVSKTFPEVETIVEPKSPQKNDGSKSFAKLFIGGLMVAGFLILLIKFLENIPLNNSFSKGVTSFTPISSSNSILSNTPRKNTPPRANARMEEDVNTVPLDTTIPQNVDLPCKGRINNPNGNVKLRRYPGQSRDNTIQELNDGSPVYVHEYSPNGKWVRVHTIGAIEGWVGSVHFVCE